MNKKMIKSLTIFSAMAMVSVPMIAQPILEKVEATLNPTIEYTLNGESILDESLTLNYQDKNYISVADLSRVLGLDVTFENGTVILTEKEEVAVTPLTPATTAEEVPMTTITPALTTEELALTTNTTATATSVELIGATIVEINEETNQITVLPAGAEDTTANYLVLNIGEETVVSEGLVVGDTVNVKHSLMKTFSIPAQSPAYEIIKADAIETPEVMVIEKATIKSVDLENGQVAILVDGQEDVPTNHILLNVSNETTTVRHEINRMAYRLESLEEGVKISVTHSPVMTLSLPPQTAAFEIVILQDQE